MTSHSRVPSAPPRDPYEDEINLEEWLRIFRGQRRLIAGAACVGVLTAAVVTYAFPPSRVATIQLLISQQPDTELTPAKSTMYRRGLESLAAAQEVVDELGLDQAPHRVSAARLRSLTDVSAVDVTGLLTIAVRSSDPGLAERAVTSLARHGVESARKVDERARILGDLGVVLRLRGDLPELLSEIQGEETGLLVIQEQLKQASLRTESLQRELVLIRVRLAKLRAKWDHIVKGIDVAEELAEQLDRLPPNSDLPASLVARHESLTGSFGVVGGEGRQVESPLRLLSTAAVSEPPGLRRWVTNLSLGLVLGLLLVVAASVVLYMVSAGRRPTIPRPTPE